MKKTGTKEGVKQVAVVGAGASGLMAAVMAAEAGAKVRILEGTAKPGQKLLLTGNGRCNLTNLDPELEQAYYSENKGEADRFVRDVMSAFGREETLAFFRETGLFTMDREGYVYPKSGQAQTVRNKLLARLQKLGVNAKTNTKVLGVMRDEVKQRWILQVEGWSYEADAVILCCGSQAAPFTGSDGSGYRIARDMGHTVSQVFPALTALSIADPALKQCAGARTRARISLWADNGHERQLVTEEEGELQWTEKEISGIAAFQLSRFVHDERKGKMLLSVDLLPEWSMEELRSELTRLLRACSGSDSLSGVLEGFVHERVAGYLAVRSGWSGKKWDPGKDASSIAKIFSELLKDLELPVSGTRGFDQAQVCRGGVRLNEVDPRTLESRLHPGLYFAGELLDIDGPCGGYNLQWAWSSGAVAGRAAARQPAEKPRDKQ